MQTELIIISFRDHHHLMQTGIISKIEEIEVTERGDRERCGRRVCVCVREVWEESEREK